MDSNEELTCPTGNVSGRDPAMPSSVIKKNKAGTGCKQARKVPNKVLFIDACFQLQNNITKQPNTFNYKTSDGSKLKAQCLSD